MFTATKNVLLPTTVTGSWPRPRWFTAQMRGRALTTCMKDLEFREQFGDALSTLLVDQQRAGLDLATLGDYFHDEDLGGHAWHRYPLERWSGLEGDFPASERLASELFGAYPPGTILREVMAAWAWPRVIGKVTPNEALPLEYAKLWRLAQARTSLPVKFGTVSAQGIGHFPEIASDRYDDDRRQLIWDMSEAMNAELRELAEAGCQVIQVEEPMIHFVAATQPQNTELLDFLIDAFNHEVEGLGGVEVWVHTCWGNPSMQRAAAVPSYANSVEAHLARMNLDVWTVEMRDGDQSELALFAPYRAQRDRKIALGVVSHRTLQVETPEDVAALTRQALRYIDPDSLVLSSDCGFGRHGANRLVAFYKAAAIAQGANIVRRELDGAEHRVPAGIPELQVDVVPAAMGRP